MNKNGVKKKKRDPNALRRYIANILFLVAQVLIRLSSKILSEDKGLVLQSQVREIQNKWMRQKKELLYGLVFIHQNHRLADVFDDEDDPLSTKRLLPTTSDAIHMIDEIIDRYENMINMCRTKRDVKALSRCLQDDYYRVFADIHQRIKRFDEYVKRWNICQEFFTRINAFQKELEEPFWQSAIMIEEAKLAFLSGALKHILKDWEQVKLQNTVSVFDTFYDNIKHREQLIERLWEEVLPKSDLCFDEYDAKNDEWHHIPYMYEQFH